MNKIINDTQCSPEIVLSWELKTKKSANYSRFRSLPACLRQKPKASIEFLRQTTYSFNETIIPNNARKFKYYHTARKAFIAVKNDKKSRVLTQNISTWSETKCIRRHCFLKKGGNTMIGRVWEPPMDMSANNIHVHPCRLQLIEPKASIPTEQNSYPN